MTEVISKREHLTLNYTDTKHTQTEISLRKEGILAVRTRCLKEKKGDYFLVAAVGKN